MSPVKKTSWEIRRSGEEENKRKVLPMVLATAGVSIYQRTVLDEYWTDKLEFAIIDYSGENTKKGTLSHTKQKKPFSDTRNT